MATLHIHQSKFMKEAVMADSGTNESLDFNLLNKSADSV